MELTRERRTLRDIVTDWRRQGLRVGVVPTMGALHAGHLSLVQTALSRADKVVVTIFVNPKQFNSATDLAAYPQTEREDAEKLAPLGAHLLYVPAAQEIYPEGFATTISVSGVSSGLCGAARPGHFDGVATVVAKLLLQTGADVAFFGEKDYQQLLVVRRLVSDLDLPVEIEACPTVREADGLAMSSRNVRLSDAEREVAPKLYAILQVVAAEIAAGRPVAEAIDAGRIDLAAAGFGAVDYLELRSAQELRLLERYSAPARLLAAVWLGVTRLIDNVAVGR